jgi:hypothetical protein
MGLLKWIKSRGFFIRITRPWPGEKGLGRPMSKGKKVTSQEIMREIKKGG